MNKKDIFTSLMPPALPGVYIFKSGQQEVLYIGKAKNLSKRIFSYNTNKQIDWKIAYLLEKSKEITWITTQNEKAALDLEAELISLHKPLFNKLLTTDAPFYYLIFIAGKKNILPQIIISRIKRSDAICHLGPFLKKKDASALAEFILDSFNLFTCTKKIPHGCLNFHIGKCSGTCKSTFDSKQYNKKFNIALAAIQSPEKIIKKIDAEIIIKKKILDIDAIEMLLSQQAAIIMLNKKIALTPPNIPLHAIYQHEINHAINQIDIQKSSNKNGLKDLAHLFNITKEYSTITIDCIDVSHFQGYFVSGACIRFTNGIFDKTNSHAYVLGSNHNNDYLNLIHTIEKQYIQNLIPLPDILLIDGGIGQLNTIVQAFSLPIHYIALAKREETLFFTDRSLKKLNIHTPIGKLLISIRNATHHAALSLHQKLRNQSLISQNQY